MDYNKPVNSRSSFLESIRLIRFASILWIGYLIVLTAINQLSEEPQVTSLLYYISLGCIALFCLILSYWQWIQERLKQYFVPMVITIVLVIPVIVSNVMSRLPASALEPLGPRFASPEGSVLAIFPFLFIGLLLVAWQYKWQYILLAILGIAGLNLGVVWSYEELGASPFERGITLTLIQTVIFLAVGFFISYLMSRLRQQQQSLEAANLRLTHYASTMEHLATSRERNRLARELHDTLAHTLSGLSVQLEAVKAYWDVDPQTARSTLEESLTAVHSGLAETRRALQALRASPLDDLGLALAIRTLVEDTAARANLTLDLSITDEVLSLAPDVEQCVYRVAQEAVTNVAKHARAENLTVNLESIDGKITLIVSDDGVGFNTESNNKESHFGLTGMRERVKLVGGEISIISKPGEGTTIKLEIQSGNSNESNNL
jgi:signal transduction histidine kinase